MKHLAILTTLFLSLAFSQAPSVVENMKADLAAGKALLLDVREASEWKEGHFVSAQLVPLSLLKQGQVSVGISKDKGVRLYLHCRSGNRVKTALPLLREMGFTNVVGLAEGYTRLKELGVK